MPHAEHVEVAKYTCFPELFSSVSPTSGQHALPDIVEFNDLPISKESLIISWAILLQVYTGEEEPAFFVDGATVKVHLPTKTYKWGHDLGKPEHGIATGIFLHKHQKPLPPALQLIYSIQTGRALIKSFNAVPTSHIQQLGKQLACIMRMQVDNKTRRPRWSEDATIQMSVANPVPTLLEGPHALHQLLDITRWKNNCAVDFLNHDGSRQQLSYADLDHRSGSLAARIRRSCGGRIPTTGNQLIIPVLIPQSPELYITLLAILRAGGAFCPLNLDAPLERIKFVAQDVAAKIIVTSQDHYKKVLWNDGPQLLVVDLVDDEEVKPENGFDLEVTAKDLAYVMYTSGSTGLPKGVRISHGAAIQSLLAHNRHIPRFERFLQFAAPTFDVFVFEMFFPLFRGATVVGSGRANLLTDLPAIVNQMQVDAAELTPTVAGGLLRKRETVPGLKLLLTIGEMLTQAIVDEFGASPGREGILYAMYGPTEAAIHCTLVTNVKANSKVGIIGTPLDSVAAYIMKIGNINSSEQEDPEILPVGQVGELVIGGHQLADGYFNRPDQTSRSFIVSEQYGPLYRTGDKARQLPDHSLEILGRISSGQVKLRGQRIELGEVEQVACKTAGVDTVHASVLGGVLVVFCIARDLKVSARDVLDTCRGWLPEFMIPADTVMLQETPRLPSGKIDRKALEAAYDQHKETSLKATECMMDNVEQIVATSIQELLGINVGRSTSLRAAGLDSLLAIRLATQLRQLGLNLGGADILVADTIAQISSMPRTISESDDDDDGHAKLIREAALNTLGLDVLPRDIEDIIACSPSQIAMLVETARHPQAYCNWVELQLPAKAGVHEIEAAFRGLAGRNEILRSGFVDIEDEVLSESHAQIIWKEFSESQFSIVSEFIYDYRIEEQEAMLRPFNVQAKFIEGAVHAVVHIHHALYDGWSWEHIVKDLEQLLSGNNPQQRPQYRKFVSWYRKSAMQMEVSSGYWQRHLRDAELSSFPNFHDRIDIEPGLEVVDRTMSFSCAELNECSQFLHVTQQAFFQAAFACILSSYHGSDDITFGTVSSGRTIPVDGIEDIIGPCLATLPIRLDMSHYRTVKDLIQHVNELNRDMIQHCTIPLREIKSACRINPEKALFDAILVWQQTLQCRDFSGESIHQVGAADYVELNLTLEIEPGPRHIQVKANYQRSIIPRTQIDTMLSQMDELIAAFLKSVTIPMAETYKCFSQSSLAIENPDFQPRRGKETLTSFVEDAARDKPNALAIEFATSISNEGLDIESITYGELNQRANRVAYHLLHLNVLPDELVCICMDKSLDLYISILAILKAGAGYLPLTPETPKDRLHQILLDAKVKICLITSELLNTLEVPKAITVIPLDRTNFTSYSAFNPKLKFHGSNLAYAVFTSGSTGTPKGVLVTQENLLSNLTILADIYPVNQQSKLLQSCSQAFDVSVFEVFFSWYMNMCLCSATKDILYRDIERAIRLMKITHLSLTPTVAALVDPDNVPKVQFLVTAGEAVTEKVLRSWAGRGLYQGYGPSETTNICTLKARMTANDAINNVGLPFTNTSAFVAYDRDDFALVPRGGLGEFCFGGDQVCRGYLNMPDLNAAKFIDHPHFGRLYRSGDYGRLLPNGSLAFVGRRDDQVKLRGQRIELGEVNNALLQSSNVRDCITLIIKQNNMQSQQLISFWVSVSETNTKYRILHSGTSTKRYIADLFESVVSLLPAYMVPLALVPVSRLPMTSQGKIDKSRLIASFRSLKPEVVDLMTRTSNTTDQQEEWTPLERDVAAAAAAITKFPLTGVRRQTSFFSLGLDSISAINMSKLLRSRGHTHVEVSIILRHSTVATLSTALSLGSKHQQSLPRSSVNLSTYFNEHIISPLKYFYEEEHKVVQKILPCTPLQEAMLSAQYPEAKSSYFNHTVFKVLGDLERLRKCWIALTSRHDILRTCFAITQDRRHAFAQVVLAEYEPSWTVIETTPVLLKATIRSQVAGMRADHTREPPYRFTAINTSEDSYFMLSMHHALYDGVAISSLLGEAEAIYKNQSLPLVVPFEHFLEQLVAQDSMKADLFWKECLAGFEPRTFPNISDAAASERQKITETDTVQLKSSKALTWIEDRCRQNSVSLLGLGQASWAKILSIYLGKTDICFGNVVSGRTIPVNGVDKIVAPCFNTLPVRVRIPPRPTNLELMNTLQYINTNNLQFQLTPLRRIQSQHNPDGRRLFDTLFILQHPSQILDPNIWELIEDIGDFDFPFVCELIPSPVNDTLEFVLHYHCASASPTEANVILKAIDDTLVLSLKHPLDPYNSSRSLPPELVSAGSISDNRAKPKHYGENHDTEHASAGERLTIDDRPGWTSYEREICNVLSSLSGISVERIGRATTIFQLGLDSISAVQVAAKLRKDGRTVSAIDILKRPSLRQMASFLAKCGSESDQEQRSFNFAAFDQTHRSKVCNQVDISSKSLESLRPCTPIQSGMIAQFLHSQGSKYFNHILMKLEPGAKCSNIRDAWTAVFDKHQMLRTGFSHVEDRQHSFCMITYRKGQVLLPWKEVVDSTDVSNTIRKLRQQAAADVHKSIHLPAWRITIIKSEMDHFLHFSAHHSLYDAQSLQLILDDVLESYRGQTLSQEASLDSIIGAILTASEVETKDAQAFWLKTGRDAFPNKFPNMSPLQLKENTTRLMSKMCSKSQSQLEEGCRTSGITIQAAGQCAWARILSAYIGETSVTFGTVLSGRNITEISGSTSFPCVVTLPVACHVSGSNQSMVERMMATNTTMLKYQFTPLRKIQRWMGRGEESIFDSIFTYQKLPQRHVHPYPWEVVDEEAMVDYAISIELQPSTGNTLQLRITFRDDILPNNQAKILLEQLDATLTDIVFCPKAACTDTSNFLVDFLSVIPRKESSLPSNVKVLHEFVEQSARQHPDKVAFEFAYSLHGTRVVKDQWNYQELDAEGNKIAHLLLKNGVIPGDLIAICFEKCPEASFAILGILKAGCAYVALDPNSPVARKIFVINDSSSKLVLTMSEQVKSFNGCREALVVALDDKPALGDLLSSVPRLARPVQGEDICYCLYTSGTTGTPKGCLISHENTVQAMLSFQRLFDGHWDTDSRWLQFAAFHFDVSVLEQYWSWSVGICVSSAPRDVIFEDIAGTIQHLGITHIDLTPSLAKLIYPTDVPSLCRGVFITGGEELKQEILDVWGSKGVIYNGYGPTEVTIGCTMYPRVPQNGKPSNIGRQFDNVGSFVLHPATQTPVIRGAVGELCVSGKLVGRGYLNRPQLTAEKFQYIDKYGERVYRTGDLVRILHDGTFMFLGRADDQIKLRGQRLEITEVNEVIKSKVQSIREVHTLVVKHPKQQKEQLVCFFVAEDLHEPVGSPKVMSGSENRERITAAKDACHMKLPSYMIPTHWIPISLIPLSVNNKVDAKQLRALYSEITPEDLQKLANTGDETNSWSDQEERVKAILLKATGVHDETVRKSSTIFELGLDSISVISFARSLRQAGFPAAQSSIFMTNPTIGGLAKALSECEVYKKGVDKSVKAAHQNIAAFAHRFTHAVSKSLHVNKTEIESISPCTALQEGMISRAQESDRPLYFGAFYFELSSDVRLDRLRDAWGKVINAVPILRTIFVLTLDGYAQVVLEGLELPWRECNVSSEADIDSLVKYRYNEWWTQNRELTKRPLEIFTIRSPKRSIMCLHIFHGLYDGISLPLMMHRVAIEHHQEANTAYGPPYPDTLAHGPLRQTDGAKELWMQHLAGSQHRSMPSLLSQPSQKDSAVSLGVNDLGKLETVRRSLSVTLQALIQACWISVLQPYLGNSFTIGVVVSGRSIDFEGADMAIGPMFNTIPLHTTLDPKETWSDLVTKCHDYNTTALPYQHTPLRDIMKWCRRTPDTPLFDTLFVFQKVVEDFPANINRLWTPLRSDSTADYPLAFEAQHQLDGSLKFTLVARGNVSDDKTSLQLLMQVRSALLQLIANPGELAVSTPASPTVNKTDGSLVTEDAQVKNIMVGNSKFEWTPQAYLIRTEIAALTNLEETALNENSSIFELGLDSIDAIKLSSRLKRSGMSLTVSTIMQTLTIAKMTEQNSIQATPPASSEDEGSDLKGYEEKLRAYLLRQHQYINDFEDILPITPLQEAMVTEMNTSNYDRYFNYNILKVAPDVNVRKLVDAWNLVLEKSPILRTSFMEVDDPDVPQSYAQIVHHYKKRDWTILQASDDEGVQKLVDNIKSTQRDDSILKPPWDLAVIRTREASYLVLSIAHALYDGWSLGLLHEDVQKAYEGRYNSRPSYRKTLEQIFNSSGLDAARFWQEVLSDASSSSFPQRESDGHHQPQIIHRIEQRSSILIKDITSFCRSHGITLQALGQTCWAFVLAHYLQKLDVVFGVVLSGRDTEIANKVLFPTMNTVAIRSVLHGSRKEMLQYVQENIGHILQYQHFPLRKAKAMVERKGQQLFDTLFIYQKRPEQGTSQDQPLYESVGGLSEVEYPVCVEMESISDHLIWRTACKDSVFDYNQTQRLLDQLDLVLQEIMYAPDAPALDYIEHGTAICGLPAFKSPIDAFPPSPILNSKRAEPPSSSLSWSKNEKIIRRVLSTVSKVPEHDISKDLTMFHLGLDSISAIKVSSLLRKGSIKLSVSDMLRAATVERIALLLDSQRSGATTSTINADIVLSESLEGVDTREALGAAHINVENVEKVTPATAGQIYMLSVWQNSRGTLFYPTFSYVMPGILRSEQLDDAWRSLINSSPILRTTFAATSSQEVPFIQVILQQTETEIIWSTRDREALRKNKKTDFTTPPVTLYAQQTPTALHLSLQIHHALYDGVSLSLLIHELQRLCNNLSPGDPASSDLGPFIASTYTQSPPSQRRQFWTSYLRKPFLRLSRQTLPLTHQRTAVFRPSTLHTTTALETYVRRQGLSIQTLFLAAYAKKHARLLDSIHPHTQKEKDVTFGIYLANRSHTFRKSNSDIPLSDLAAPTLNLIPLHIKAPQHRPLIDVARAIQEDLGEIIKAENSCVSLYEIEEWAGCKIDCFVNFLKMPDPSAEDPAGEGSLKGDAVVIEEVKGDWDGAVTLPVESPQHEFILPSALQNNLVKDSYIVRLPIPSTPPPS
ncbi:MAG: NRPS [Pycnora praestabilis]|nr:MAG: NRPS [Pycnora praestabilis]